MRGLKVMAISVLVIAILALTIRVGAEVLAETTFVTGKPMLFVSLLIGGFSTWIVGFGLAWRILNGEERS